MITYTITLLAGDGIFSLTDEKEFNDRQDPKYYANKREALADAQEQMKLIRENHWFSGKGLLILDKNFIDENDETDSIIIYEEEI